MQQSIKKQDGYLLLELAIVMIVIGFLITALFPFYQSYLYRGAIVDTKKRMVIVSKAFSTYVQTHWRLPCPANSSVAAGEQLGLERMTAVVGDGCDAAAVALDPTVSHGIVPYRTLGIPEQYAKDGYGNFFTYVVSPDYTVDNRLGVSPDFVNRRLAHLVAGDDNGDGDSNDDGRFALLPRAQFCAPLNNSATDIVIIQDGATLYQGGARTTNNIARTINPNPNLNREDAVTSVAMVLISHGENKAGAYQSDGNQYPASAVGTSEEITSRNDNGIVQMESNYANTGVSEYDDIVNFYTQDEIYALAGRNSCEHL